MAPSSRDRISVDLHGLKAALIERAQFLGTSPSALVRASLADALGRAMPHDFDRLARCETHAGDDRVRLSLRMKRKHARATVDAARSAGLHPGDYVAGLVADIPVLSNGRGRIDHITALTASSAELATLSRNVHRLAEFCARPTWNLRGPTVRCSIRWPAMCAGISKWPPVSWPTCSRAGGGSGSAAASRKRIGATVVR